MTTHAPGVGELDPREIPHPPHRWENAKRVIRDACAPADHHWLDLELSQSRNENDTEDVDGPTYRPWRECQRCGIADVTARAIAKRLKRSIPITEVAHELIDVDDHTRSIHWKSP